jgi:WD40 repeat protein
MKEEQRQRSPVGTIICSPDESLVATASYDQIVLWDVSTGQETQKIEHDYGVHALAFSPTGSIIASACGDYTVRLWSCSTGELMQRIAMETLVPSIAFSEDGRILETESGSFTVEYELPLPQIKQSHFSPSHGFSVSHQWVRHQGKNLLWLPVDYRASCWASCGKVLAIGRDSGLIAILEPTER